MQTTITYEQLEAIARTVSGAHVRGLRQEADGSITGKVRSTGAARTWDACRWLPDGRHRLRQTLDLLTSD